MPEQPSLVLDTSGRVNGGYEAEMDISSLPSPRLDGSGSFNPFNAPLPQAPLQRLPSNARPQVDRFAAAGALASGPHTSPGRMYPRDPALSINIPKRGELMRQLSTIALHREKQRITTPATAGAPTSPYSDRFLDAQDVYIAFDKHLNKTTWDRVRALGKGSFSKVILATPTLSQVTPGLENLARSILVAVKITKLGEKGTQQRAQLEEAMRRDIGLVKKLSHPCLIDILAYNFDEDRALVILPLYKGGDLFDLISHHLALFSPALVKRIVHDLVSAVAYMHSENVVHRDIKLENLLIDLSLDDLLSIDPVTYPHPVAVLTDLGLSRSIDPEDPMLTTRCGSEDYVPPEIILSQPYDGRQTDVWAIGVLVYAVLEGRLPFDAPPRTNSGRVVKTAHRIARNDWAWHRLKVAPPEWEDLKELVNGCLQKRDRGRLSTSEILELEWFKKSAPESVVKREAINPCSVFKKSNGEPRKLPAIPVVPEETEALAESS